MTIVFKEVGSRPSSITPLPCGSTTSRVHQYLARRSHRGVQLPQVRLRRARRLSTISRASLLKRSRASRLSNHHTAALIRLSRPPLSLMALVRASLPLACPLYLMSSGFSASWTPPSIIFPTQLRTKEQQRCNDSEPHLPHSPPSHPHATDIPCSLPFLNLALLVDCIVSEQSASLLLHPADVTDLPHRPTIHPPCACTSSETSTTPSQSTHPHSAPISPSPPSLSLGSPASNAASVHELSPDSSAASARTALSAGSGTKSGEAGGEWKGMKRSWTEAMGTPG